MEYIEPHIHMVSRVTDDYVALARSGCVAVSEPAFWPGFDRCSPDGFRDYFSQLTEFEPTRAAKFGLQHFAWMCVNAKEAENVALSRQVIALLPEFLDRPNVLGVGEIGLNKNTPNETTVFQEQLQLAVQRNELVLIHTPHLEDKYMGTRMIIDMLKEQGANPDRVLIDHVEEHTIGLARDAGCWCGLTLYPVTKCTVERAADLVEMYGPERITVNSAADWGPSHPLAVADFILEMRARGHHQTTIRKLVYDNPLSFFSQCPRFQLSLHRKAP